MKAIFQIISVLLVIIFAIAEIVIYFTAVVPGEHTNFGLDWYIICHYWRTHLVFLFGYIGVVLLFRE